jgi:hypothetical protein
VNVEIAQPPLVWLDEALVRVAAPWVVKVDGETFTVPVGFESNLASVPRVPFAFWLFGDKARLAALFHDAGYTFSWKPRAWMDEAFSAVAKATKVAGWRAGLMWAAVRVAGGAHYGKAAP